MKIKFVILGILFASISCRAQEKPSNNECYKNTWAKWIKNELPQSICVGENEMIYYLTDDFDFDKDGLNDIAIKIGKKERKNGDVRKLFIYQKINDSTFTKFRELDNVYPLWFEDYDPSVKVGDSKIDAVKEYYEGNPLRWIELVDNKIKLTLNGDVVTEYILTYTYFGSKEDWILTDYVEYDLHNNVKKPFLSDKIGTSISEFSYIKFLNGEF
jgi:hypothetical protein